jgi:hypothetical protein
MQFVDDCMTRAVREEYDYPFAVTSSAFEFNFPQPSRYLSGCRRYWEQFVDGPGQSHYRDHQAFGAG